MKPASALPHDAGVSLPPKRRLRAVLLATVLVAVVALMGATRPRPREVEARDGSILLLVPAGSFVMGSAARPDESPVRTLDLPDFSIGRCEVTNRQFARFVQESGYRPEGCWKEYALPGREDHPAACVTRADAEAYCRHFGLRLPTEEEWEKAARGPDGRTWPWGHTWSSRRCNNIDLEDPARLALMAPVRGRRGTMPVGSFPEGASPCGALDMAGNVWEWCSGTYGPYPGSREQDPDYSRGLQVARGGGWHHDGPECMTGSRRLKFAQECSLYIGFRVAR